jgi:hypothetical protein
LQLSDKQPNSMAKVTSVEEMLINPEYHNRRIDIGRSAFVPDPAALEVREKRLEIGE